ncbi:MAG: ThiF family adenylyltransferase [Candidatus Heimdallarchaeota archaeon]|nr:ThiF family adenylyltransferase [Candidatus Heimdallarchaeota archaeon]MBY8995555.1 ThiF family adenylyltransferase [Candidatus Heimdallarchaeota archaeon]
MENKELTQKKSTHQADSVSHNSAKEKELLSVGFFEEDIEDRTRRYFGKENLQKIKNSTILCVGAGAVGNEICKNLGMLGVGHIKLVDFDIVNKSNINRCIFFRPGDHKNISKVNAVAERLPEIAPNTKVTPYEVRIEEAPQEVYQVDLIIMALDNDYARYMLNYGNLMQEKTVPMINGAMGKSFIEAQIYHPGITACAVCLWSEDYYQAIMNHQVVLSCDEFFVETLPKFPMISTLTSIVGGIMSVEATKVLVSSDGKGEYSDVTKGQEPNFGKMIRYDLRNHEMIFGNILPNHKCVDVTCRARRRTNKISDR